nr:putative ribonuclease h protein [Quercus suber]
MTLQLEKLNAGGGGILRSDTGAWIKAFSRNIGITTSLLAELWEIRDGLSMCLDLRIYAVIVESDAKVVVDLINNDSLSNASLQAHSLPNSTSQGGALF